MDFISDWFRRHFADKQLVILILLMFGAGIVIYLFGHVLAPVFAAVIFAYLLEGAIKRLERLSIPQRLSFWLVFASAMAAFLLVVFGMIPVLFREVTALIQQVPEIMSAAKRLMIQLPAKYPELITPEQVNELFAEASAGIIRQGQNVLSYSLTSAVTAITLLVYLILVPFLVFFLVKDKDLIIGWLLKFLPEERPLTNHVWREVDGLIDRYIQGKVWEIVIVGMITYAVFLFLDLDYALSLAAVTGVSVLVPYIGATIVTIPVAFVAFYQFGWSSELGYVIGAYLLVQALDGNVLVPLLFGEAVRLHPVAIILAVLFFGGMWGFWGVFFAIPLATLISAVISAWPDLEVRLETIPEPPAEEPQAGETSTSDQAKQSTE